MQGAVSTNLQIKSKSVIIADDHAIVRQGVRAVLGQIPNIHIVGEAVNGLEAIAMVKMHKPDMLVVDAAMPLAKGIEVLADTKRWSPETKIVLLTGFTANRILGQWLDAGVDGITLKSCTPDVMETAFRIVLEGGKFIAEDAQAILEENDGLNRLTLRETEVLSMIAGGHQNSSIAEQLGISKRTVEKHRGSLMVKLDVTTVAELMTFALREGLLDEHTQL